MSVVTAVTIRDVMIARLIALAPTTLAGVTFIHYPRAGSVEYDNVVVPNHRVFEIDIGESIEVFADGTATSSGAEVEMQTRFTTTVLYKVGADLDALAQMVREDILLVRNALRSEISGQISIIPDPGLPRPTRTATMWSFAIEGHAQHAEAEWSAT